LRRSRRGQRRGADGGRLGDGHAAAGRDGGPQAGGDRVGGGAAARLLPRSPGKARLRVARSEGSPVVPFARVRHGGYHASTRHVIDGSVPTIPWASAQLRTAGEGCP